MRKPGEWRAGNSGGNSRSTAEDRRFKGLPPPAAPRSRPSTPPAPYASPPLARTNITPNPLARRSDQPRIEIAEKQKKAK